MNMKVGALAASLVALLFAPGAAHRALAQGAEPFRAELTVRADQPKGVIARNIYDHFAEHLGRLVYERLWVGPSSPIPNTRGIRNDVVAALRNLNVPVDRK